LVFSPEVEVEVRVNEVDRFTKVFKEGLVVQEGDTDHMDLLREPEARGLEHLFLLHIS
jgi:hypothetical protein